MYSTELGIKIFGIESNKKTQLNRITSALTTAAGGPITIQYTPDLANKLDSPFVIGMCELPHYRLRDEVSGPLKSRI